MIEKTYVCASCKRRFTIKVLEQGEPLPPNTSPSAPSCECGSTALLDPDDLKVGINL